MKNLIALSLVSALCLGNVFAQDEVKSKPVSKERLKNVNAFIKYSLEAEGEEDLKVTVTSAKENSEGLLTEVKSKAEWKDVAKVELDLKMAGGKVELGVSARLEAEEFVGGISEEQMNGMLGELNQAIGEAIAKINEVGLYTANASLKTTKEGIFLEFDVEPTEENERPSIEVAMISVTYTKKTAVLEIEAAASMNAEADLVARGQTALTNIFVSLSNAEEPRDEDFKELGAVIEEVLANVSVVLGEEEEW